MTEYKSYFHLLKPEKLFSQNTTHTGEIYLKVDIHYLRENNNFRNFIYVDLKNVLVFSRYSSSLPQFKDMQIGVLAHWKH